MSGITAIPTIMFRKNSAITPIRVVPRNICSFAPISSFCASITMPKSSAVITSVNIKPTKLY